MTTLVYPSPDFPGLPSVALEVPGGWEPAHAPGTTLAARLPREGAFAPNVVVSIEACPPSYDLDESLGQIRAMAHTRGGAASEAYAARLGGRDFVGCDATWPDPDVETILQANLFAVVTSGPPDRPGHLVQLTGAVGGPDAERDYELVRAVLSTVRVRPWTPGAEEKGRP